MIGARIDRGGAKHRATLYLIFLLTFFDKKDYQGYTNEYMNKEDGYARRLLFRRRSARITIILPAGWQLNHIGENITAPAYARRSANNYH
jgi:hypothetical protein